MRIYLRNQLCKRFIALPEYSCIIRRIWLTLAKFLEVVVIFTKGIIPITTLHEKIGQIKKRLIFNGFHKISPTKKNDINNIYFLSCIQYYKHICNAQTALAYRNLLIRLNIKDEVCM